MLIRYEVCSVLVCTVGRGPASMSSILFVPPNYASVVDRFGVRSAKSYYVGSSPIGCSNALRRVRPVDERRKSADLPRKAKKYKSPCSLTEQNTSLRSCEIEGLSPSTGTILIFPYDVTGSMTDC